MLYAITTVIEEATGVRADEDFQSTAEAEATLNRLRALLRRWQKLYFACLEDCQAHHDVRGTTAVLIGYDLLAHGREVISANNLYQHLEIAVHCLLQTSDPGNKCDMV